MNELNNLREDFFNKKLSKPSYIDQVFNYHNVLFQYKDYIKESDVAKIEIIDDNIIITSRQDGIKMYIDLDDKRCTPLEILNFGTYEGEDSFLMYALIQPNDIVFDIGANLGWCSLNFSKLVTNGKVFSFEPLPKTFEKCQNNLVLNNTKNVQVYNIALSNQEGEVKFFFNEKSSNSSSMKNLLNYENTIEVACKVTTLDVFIKEHGGVVDFIKSDVEGAELLVYQGAMDTLKNIRPIIFTEMLRKWSAKYNYHPNDIISLFRNIGYQCYYAKDDKLQKISTCTILV